MYFGRTTDAIEAMKQNGFFRALAFELEKHPEAGFFVTFGGDESARYLDTVTMTAKKWDEKRCEDFLVAGSNTYTKFLHRQDGERFKITFTFCLGVLDLLNNGKSFSLAGVSTRFDF